MEPNLQIEMLNNQFELQEQEPFEEPDPADYLEQTVWLLKKNQYSRKPRINVILSIFTTALTFLTMCIYIMTLWKYIIILPIFGDIVLTGVSIHLYKKYPLVFGVQAREVKATIRKEAYLFVIKTVLIFLITLNLMINAKSIASCLLLSLLCMSMIFIDCRRTYDTVYDSVFNFMGITTLMFTWFKIYGGAEVSWRGVFIFYYITAWFTCVIFLINAAIYVFLGLYEVFTKSINIRFKIGLLHLFLALNFAFVSMAYFGVSDYFDPRARYFIDIRIVLSLSVVYFILHGFVVIYFDEELNQVFVAAEQGTMIKERKGLNYVLNMIRATPTFFIQSPRGSMKFDENDDEINEKDSDCIICCTDKANCVIFKCMHSGICRNCCVNLLKKDQNCMLCRKPISKICVTERLNIHEYKVIEEISFASKATTSNSSQQMRSFQ